MCVLSMRSLAQEEQLMLEQGIQYAQIGVKTANDIDQPYTEKVLAKIEEVRVG